MAQVRVNNELCTVHIKGDVVLFVYVALGAEPLRLGARDVSQMLRSRKDERAAKLVAEGTAYLLNFDSLHDREAFIEAIVHVQEAPVEPTHESWVTASICHAAVDVGVVDEVELQRILAADGQRGVECPFDALDSLVDRDTFELRPITEQMENDVLRQIPVLAAIFCERVVDAETRRAFWEAVVRKYFCFSRTFLEEDMQRLEQAHAPPAVTAAASLTTPTGSALTAINAASLSALPHRAAVAVRDTDVDEADLARLAEDEVAASREAAEESFVFRATSGRTACDLGGVGCPVSGPLLAFPSGTSAEEEAVSKTPFTGRRVLRQLPSESLEKAALEMLRLFWRSAAPQRKTVLAKYTVGKRGQVSFLQRVCLEQANRVAQDEGAE